MIVHEPAPAKKAPAKKATTKRRQLAGGAVRNLRRHGQELRFIRIHGKVQGVGYRFCDARRSSPGLKGLIQNNHPMAMEATLEGEKSAIDEWIEELKEGPRYAEVTSIDQESKDF